MRYVLAHQGAYPIKNTVAQIIESEMNQGLDRLSTFQTFNQNIRNSKERLVRLLSDLKGKGKRVAGYGATSKSTTILNYCGIRSDLVEWICDTTPIKQGKFTPGTHIPVVPYEKFRENPPDYALLLAWNHSEEIMAKEHDFITQGGKWIVHVPEVKVF